jgi:molybdopterin synthase sulfur carrier subunit
MAVMVRIPTPLRKLTGGKAELEAEGRTVREVFDHIERMHEGIQRKIFDEGGELRRFINVFVNGEDVRQRGGVETPVKAGDEVSVVPAIAGGAAAGGAEEFSGRLGASIETR